MVVGMTGTGTLTITDFILDRIAEDEESASRYHRLLCLRTACDNEGCVWDDQERIEDERVCTCGYPARVLAGCKAKRAIVGAHQSYVMAEGEVCENCRGEEKDEWFREPWPCATVRHLAAVYASHPDYDPAWAPES